MSNANGLMSDVSEFKNDCLWFWALLASSGHYHDISKSLKWLETIFFSNYNLGVITGAVSAVSSQNLLKQCYLDNNVQTLKILNRRVPWSIQKFYSIWCCWCEHLGGPLLILTHLSLCIRPPDLKI